MKALRITAELTKGHPTAHFTPWPDVDTLLMVTPYARPSVEYRTWLADLEKMRALLHYMGLIRTERLPPMLSFDLDIRPRE